MNLLIFNSENTSSATRRFGIRSICFSRKTGQIYISRSMAVALKLENASKLLFARNESGTKDWYVCRTEREDGIKIKSAKSGSSFTNRILVNTILDQFKIENQVTFLIGETPVVSDGETWYRILTSAPVLKKSRKKAITK